MKKTTIPTGLMLATVTAFLFSSVVLASPNDEAALTKEAKISRADAEKTALANVPNGSIKGGEIEREDGKLVWSFDIASPGTKDITEIQIDAITGKVARTEIEKPKEADVEKAEKK